MQQVLVKNIEKAVEKSVGELIKTIAKSYEVSEADLWSLWSNKTPVADSSEGCPYRFTKKPREGEICGRKSKDGGVYCSTHRAKEGKEPKQKKTLPTVPTSPPVGDSKRLLRKHAVHGLTHTETGLVFNDNKEATGILKSGKVLALDEEGVDLCKKWGFKYVAENAKSKTSGKKEKDVKPKKKVKEESDSEEEKEEKEEKDDKKKVKSKKKVKEPESDSDEDSEEDDKVPTKTQKNVHKALGLNDDSSDSEQDD